MTVIPQRDTCPIDGPGTHLQHASFFFLFMCTYVFVLRPEKLKQLSQQGSLLLPLVMLLSFIYGVTSTTERLFWMVRRAQEGVRECEARAQVCAPECVVAGVHACMCVGLCAALGVLFRLLFQNVVVP